MSGTRQATSYRKFNIIYYDDIGFNKLNATAKLVVYYLLAGPQTTRIGIFHVKVGHACADLSLSAEEFTVAVNAIVDALHWEYDCERNVVLIPEWWRDNQPENPNVVIGAAKDMARTPHDSPLVKLWFDNLECIESHDHRDLLRQEAERALRTGRVTDFAPSPRNRRQASPAESVGPPAEAPQLQHQLNSRHAREKQLFKPPRPSAAARRRTQGLCEGCGEPRDDGFIRCTACRERHNAQRRDERRGIR